MKKIFWALTLAALLPWSIAAQDARQRTIATIIADALDQLPAAKQQDYNNVMNELASTGTAGIALLGEMLVPADKGKNASVEYALHGVVSYVTAPDKADKRTGVRKGLAEAIEKCTDNPNRAFLMSLLQRCATDEDIPVFVKYLNDAYLAEWAINGLAHTEGTNETLLDLIKKDAAPREKLAYAVGVKRLRTAEPILLEWLKNADVPTQKAIYHALGICGSSASLPVLEKAAKAVKYEWIPETDVTACYLRLLKTMVANDKGHIAANAAKRLMKDTDEAYVRGGALDIIIEVEGKKATPYILAALKDANREYRVNALRLSESVADENLYTNLAKTLKTKDDRKVKADILNWFGTNHVMSQIDAVIANMNSNDEEIAIAAITAAGKIGGDAALEALIAKLNSNYADAATKALLSFNGKINDGIMKALDTDKTTIRIAALNLASTRSMDQTADKVFDMLSFPESEVSTAAYKALAGVVGPSDFERLSRLIEKESGRNIPQIQKAMRNAVMSLPKDEQYAAVIPYVNKSGNPSLYYPVLAQAGNPEAIAEILKGYNGNHKQEAFASLLNVDNTNMIEVLYNIAVNDKANTQAALDRYTSLVAKSANTSIRKYQLYRRALEIASDVKVQNRLINLLGETHTYQALMLVEKYMDNKATAETAAEAVRAIASKNSENFGGEPVRKALEKAIACFKEAGHADAGYAIDDISAILQRLPQAAYIPVFGNTEWTVIALDPAQKASMNPKKIKKHETLAAAATAGLWKVTENGMAYAGGEKSILGTGNYENFELWFEWKGAGKAGLGVRSIRQIDLGGDKSGALSGNMSAKNTPEKVADNMAGEWNTVYVKVLNDRVTVSVNGVVTADNVILENTCDRNIPAYVEGQLMLIGESAPVEYREMYIRELPSTPKFELSAKEAKEGFEVLFDGTSMHKWTGNTTDYIPVDGTIYVTAQYGGRGNLYTVKEYSDFIFRFEFAFMREGVNNGVGIRTPMGVDAAYEGMEIQILDHDAPIYKGLHEYQQHGSVYGIIPAKRVKFPALGEWNVEEIRAVGDRITVTVNGEVILDGNIREACQGHNVSEDGSTKNPYTVDKKNHPGLFNKSGHVGFLGHGPGVKFRNIRIKDLSK
ncbi:DUF1080 domain-containing protein [Bacteroides ovatus]|uniref:DUF1080 domain-containing protein n=1 Tax=Bacteroides ovatus TaxID=28116 RepID=UPI0018986B5C|nr:family 16 glycoside hydrolase [Bacteroides ovatus]MDC2624684.1 DUF1080 domain-containing protein [Bacteroides ovatus]MDC2638547.1 DUF1080 domain-containing protein [Bacteroides ovatus]MDC2651111.1 DUF1080 domain-containing protein [Bacteroides ovatus]